MGIQFADPGGEYYFSLNTVLAPGVWSGQNNSNLVSNAPAGAATQYGIVVSPGGTFFKNLASNFARLVIGGRFYVGGSFSANTVLFQVMDGSSNQVEVRVDGLGHLYVARNGTQLGSVSTNQLAAASGWHYVELDVTINGSTGAAQVWVDNVSWINLSGQNTQNTANAFANRVQYSNTCTVNSYWKDMYILDTGTGVNTSRLGDITVGVIYPNAAGSNQAWTNNGGASQTASVQDGITHTGTWPDGDTTYISSNTANQISDFAHQALSLTGTIFAVVHASYMRKDDAGSRTVSQVCLSGATTEVGASISLGNSYQYYYDILEQDPNTSAQWGTTGFNAATFGVKELT